MKKEYWDVTDEQVIEKTGKPIADWIIILDAFKASEKKSNDVVAYLQQEHNVPALLGTYAYHLLLKK